MQVVSLKFLSWLCKNLHYYYIFVNLNRVHNQCLFDFTCDRLNTNIVVETISATCRNRFIVICIVYVIRIRSIGVNLNQITFSNIILC